MPASRPWTDEETETVRRERAAGRSCDEIAQMLDRTTIAVHIVWCRLQTAKRRRPSGPAFLDPPEEIDVPLDPRRVADLHARGVGLTAIARLTGQKYSEVEAELRRLKLLRSGVIPRLPGWLT